MTHITFIHGIGNKPPAPDLLRSWLAALAADGGPDLSSSGITTTIVYWADVLYAKPVPQPELEQLVALSPELSDLTGDLQVPVARTPEEAEFLTMLAAKLGGAMVTAEAGLAAEAGESLTEVPLPWPIKKKLLEIFLRDAHHYLFDVQHQPRPGVSYQVRQEIRRRFVSAVQAVPGGECHLVIAHSLGSVIAYDCMKNVPECGAVDAFVTIGSPLGLSEVQDRLGPGYSRSDGFPADRLSGPWTNLADRLDPVSGLDCAVGGDYRRSGVEVVKDVIVVNHGSWRHAALQYLQRQEVREAVRTGLGI